MQLAGQNDEALSSLLSLLRSNSANETENAHSTQSRPHRRLMTPPSMRIRGDTSVISKALTIDDLRSFFHLPIVEVAKQLGTCTTALKKICRKNKIMKWPYRQIRSITKSIQSLEMASLNDTLPADLKFQYREQVFELQKAIDEIIQDPNTDVSMHLKEGFDMDGDDFDDNDHNDNDSAMHSRRFSAPSSNVMQIMQAAAATAGFETSTSKSSSNSANSKRKREEDTLKALKEGEIVPEMQTPTIGITTVGLVTTADLYRNVYFVGPVHLAPLERKKVKSTKKLVPLIEPDICNHYKMEFLPNSILRHSDKYTNKAMESAIIAGYPPQMVSGDAPEYSTMEFDSGQEAQPQQQQHQQQPQQQQHQQQPQQQQQQQQQPQQQQQQQQPQQQQPQQQQPQQQQPQQQQQHQHQQQQPQQQQQQQPLPEEDQSSRFNNHGQQSSGPGQSSTSHHAPGDFDQYSQAAEPSNGHHSGFQNQGSYKA